MGHESHPGKDGLPKRVLDEVGAKIQKRGTSRLYQRNTRTGRWASSSSGDNREV